MKSIHVFFRRNRLQESFGVHLGRKRKLQQDAVNIVALIEGLHQGQHLFRGHRIGWA